MARFKYWAKTRETGLDVGSTWEYEDGGKITLLRIKPNVFLLEVGSFTATYASFFSALAARAGWDWDETDSTILQERATVEVRELL